MLLYCCLACNDHIIETHDDTKFSYCLKENCWSRYSRCVADKALTRYLSEQRTTTQHSPRVDLQLHTEH
jgi:hypothetical protein